MLWKTEQIRLVDVYDNMLDKGDEKQPGTPGVLWIRDGSGHLTALPLPGTVSLLPAVHI